MAARDFIPTFVRAEDPGFKAIVFAVLRNPDLKQEKKKILLAHIKEIC